MKKCSTPLAIREIKSKLPRVPLTPVRAASVSETKSIDVVEMVVVGVGEHHWWECKLVQPSWKSVWKCLQILEEELPHDPATPLLGVQ
jgi:hypothetical protein